MGRDGSPAERTNPQRFSAGRGVIGESVSLFKGESSGPTS